LRSDEQAMQVILTASDLAAMPTARDDARDLVLASP
jgi:hypothetical protein